MPSRSASTRSSASILPVAPVAAEQHQRGQQGRDHGGGQDRDLGVVVVRGAEAEREFGDQQRDGEADAGEQADAEQVHPLERGVQPGAGEPASSARWWPGCRPACRAPGRRRCPAPPGRPARQRGRPMPPMATPAEKNANSGTATPAEKRAEPVLEDLGQPRAGLGSGAALAVQDRDGEAQHDAGDGRVDAGGVEQGPGDDAERQQDEPGGGRVEAEEPAVPLGQERVDGDRDQGQQQRDGRGSRWCRRRR